MPSSFLILRFFPQLGLVVVHAVVVDQYDKGLAAQAWVQYWAFSLYISLWLLWFLIARVTTVTYCVFGHE